MGALADAGVRLVREYKGPTVGDLTAGGEAVDLLPGRVRAVFDAIAGDDLALANHRLEIALGALHQGPGFRRRRLRIAYRRMLLAFAAVLSVASLALLCGWW